MTRPVRGTRPSNRRALVVAAAAEQFHRRGYPNVSMKDIAEAVAVGPSALYRHFRNKNELLEACVADGLDAVSDLLDDRRGVPISALVDDLAVLMLTRREVGVLWRREARHLDRTAKDGLRQQIRSIGSRLSTALTQERPEIDWRAADFLAWALLGVATSVSFHDVVTRPDLLAEMMRETIGADIVGLDAGSARGETPERTWTASRREAILTSAARLFAENGFAEVGMDDIGSAVGIAGPSIYNHFASKADILCAAIMRGNDILRAEMHRALSRATGPADALRRLVSGYRDFVFENVDLITLLTTEIDQLSPDDQHTARVAQREYIDAWVGLLRQCDPAVDVDDQRTRVQGVLVAINDVSATHHLRILAGIGPATAAVAEAVLGLE